MTSANNAETITRERELYRSLLRLGEENELEPCIRDALNALVKTTGAQCGYLEIESEQNLPKLKSSISFGYSEDEVSRVRQTISEGILSAALLSGDLIETDSAMSDPRFMARKSVQAAKIESVLCVPIRGTLSRGVVYLQGNRKGGKFSDDDRVLVEDFARYFGPISDRILLEKRVEEVADHTLAYREALQCEHVVGRSRALAKLLEDLAGAAPLDMHVLLTGESGTGKTMIARVLHDSCDRSEEPFVELNCAAIPEQLFENELFGHEEGAFTGAIRNVRGKVETAGAGTLFLDEIGELSLSSQAKLLQLLQSGKFFRIGGSEEKTCLARIVAATNVDLDAAVEEGRFRRDLLYRLSVLPIRVPSLRERVSDIPILTEKIMEWVSRRHGFASDSVSFSAVAALESAEWPGNIRQLEHVITAGLVRAHRAGCSELSEADFFPKSVEPADDSDADASLQEATRRFQRQYLEKILIETDWNVTKAAALLDVHRSYVYKLIESFDLTRPAGHG